MGALHPSAPTAAWDLPENGGAWGRAPNVERTQKTRPSVF